jgi:hypothetical protein
METARPLFQIAAGNSKPTTAFPGNATGIQIGVKLFPEDGGEFKSGRAFPRSRTGMQIGDWLLVADVQEFKCAAGPPEMLCGERTLLLMDPLRQTY